MDTNISPKLLNDKEVASLLGLAVQTLRNARCAGTGLPYVRLGRLIRYQPEDIQHYLEKCRIAPRDE